MHSCTPGNKSFPRSSSQHSVFTLFSAFITLKELKHSKLSSIFFNTFVNIDKYLDYEQRDPVASSKTQDLSDWDKYAAEQYELLISEEEQEE